MRRLARYLALFGAVAIGFFLFRSSPREVTLVYNLARSPGARELEVVLKNDKAVLRRARFFAPPAEVRHKVELPDGSYRLDFRLDAPGGPFEGEKAFMVTEAGTIVLALGP